MDLQISLFLLFLLFTAGQSLSCYECSGSCTQTTCDSGVSSCVSLTAYYGDTRSVSKGCAPATVCPTGSVNLGILKASSYCCNTDLCNFEDAPDPGLNPPNGLKCYYCDAESCSNTLSCSGTEDRCITDTSTIRNQIINKGCVSKSICDFPESISILSKFTCCEGDLCNGDNSVSTTQSPIQSTTQSPTQTTTQTTTKSTTQSPIQSTTQTTTQTTTQSTTKSATQKPNGAQSVSQSFLFLCCSLLSFIILH